MSNPFIRKLEHGAKLTDEDRALLASVSSNPRTIRARKQIIGEDDPPSNVHLIMEGLACRYKVLADGKRQILALFLPGDICDLHVHILGWMDHSIGTITECQLVELTPEVVDTLTDNKRTNRALWWSTLVDEGTLREWLVNMGQRPADRQLGHLLCELLFRYRLIGCAPGDSYILPMTQEELADTLGLTPVHVNRMVRELRERNLVELKRQRVTIFDVEGLIRFSEFNANYLHIRDPRDKGGTSEGGLV